MSVYQVWFIVSSDGMQQLKWIAAPSKTKLEQYLQNCGRLWHSSIWQLHGITEDFADIIIQEDGTITHPSRKSA
jgi:hypothetical protein